MKWPNGEEDLINVRVIWNKLDLRVNQKKILLIRAMYFNKFERIELE